MDVFQVCQSIPTGYSTMCVSSEDPYKLRQIVKRKHAKAGMNKMANIDTPRIGHASI